MTLTTPTTIPICAPDPQTGLLEITVESRITTPVCGACGERGVGEGPADRRPRGSDLFRAAGDAAVAQAPVPLPEGVVRVGSWTHEAPRIAAPPLSLTDRAARWATLQVGRAGRAVSDVACELGADWHAIEDAVIAYGQALLDADADRAGAVAALGVDEVLFGRFGNTRTPGP